MQSYMICNRYYVGSCFKHTVSYSPDTPL